VVDAAIVDGVTSLMTQFAGMALRGQFVEQRESNMLDGAAPYYTVYETADGQHVGVGAIEPQFFAQLCERIGLAPDWAAAQHDRARWPALRAAMAAVFRTRTREAWTELLQDTDSCVSPVLALGEAARHPHNAARATVVDIGGVPQPAPAPRFSRTPSQARAVATTATDGAQVLTRWAAAIKA
jgi:alpha-methylacyl-CoA racemase